VVNKKKLNLIENVISMKYNYTQANDIRSRGALCTPSLDPSLNVDIF